MTGNGEWESRVSWAPRGEGGANIGHLTDGDLADRLMATTSRQWLTGTGIGAGPQPVRMWIVATTRARAAKAPKKLRCSRWKLPPPTAKLVQKQQHRNRIARPCGRATEKLAQRRDVFEVVGNPERARRHSPAQGRLVARFAYLHSGLDSTRIFLKLQPGRGCCRTEQLPASEKHFKLVK